MDKWLGINVRRIYNLGLDFGPKRRILDLGSGAGYFLHISKRLGHDVLGLDIPEPAWYGDITRLLGVPRVIQRINPLEPLPDLGKPFDSVTAFMICFNDHLSETPWGIAEWRFFLDDLWTRLRPGAFVWFELNPGKDGTHYTPELKQFFEDRGAIVDRNRLVWGMKKSRYLALKRLASKMAS
jgi:SAM-dependent methyltransferase